MGNLQYIQAMEFLPILLIIATVHFLEMTKEHSFKTCNHSFIKATDCPVRCSNGDCCGKGTTCLVTGYHTQCISNTDATTEDSLLFDLDDDDTAEDPSCKNCRYQTLGDPEPGYFTVHIISSDTQWKLYDIRLVFGFTIIVILVQSLV